MSILTNSRRPASTDFSRAVFWLLFSVLLALIAQAANAEDLDRARYVSSAQTYVNADETVRSLVGIDATHPRYAAFVKGFEGMFSNDILMGAMYDALKEADLLKDSTPRLVKNFIREWMVSIGRKGVQRLETDDQEFLLAARLAFFESMPTEQCGRQLKSDQIDGKQFYSWLATVKSDNAVSEFLRIATEGVVREVTKLAPSEQATEKQVEVAAELVGRNIAKRYGESKAKLVFRSIEDQKSVADYDYCIAARLIWRETLSLKGSVRRWMIRGIFM